MSQYISLYAPHFKFWIWSQEVSLIFWKEFYSSKQVMLQTHFSLHLLNFLRTCWFFTMLSHKEDYVLVVIYRASLLWHHKAHAHYWHIGRGVFFGIVCNIMGFVPSTLEWLEASMVYLWHGFLLCYPCPASKYRSVRISFHFFNEKNQSPSNCISFVPFYLIPHLLKGSEPPIIKDKILNLTSWSQNLSAKGSIESKSKELPEFQILSFLPVVPREGKKLNLRHSEKNVLNH